MPVDNFKRFIQSISQSINRSRCRSFKYRLWGAVHNFIISIDVFTSFRQVCCVEMNRKEMTEWNYPHKHTHIIHTVYCIF